MTKSKLNDFITVNMPIMKSYGRQIINSFETGCDFIHELPDSIIQYLSHIRMRIIENSELELYVLSKMKSKLL